LKKNIRAQLDMPGGSFDLTPTEDELGDVVICCSLLANRLGINLGDVVARKFNKTSNKHGFCVLLPESPSE
jgi:NTP pyrophosphatase (non-canonical NTP hydrolase)